MAFEPLSEKVKRAANKMDFLIVLQEQIEEENLPYANVIYTLLLLSAGTQKPLIHYKKRKSLLALYFTFPFYPFSRFHSEINL